MTQNPITPRGSLIREHGEDANVGFPLNLEIVYTVGMAKTREERLQQIRDYGKKYREAGRLKEHKQATIHGWLVDRLGGMRSSSIKRGLPLEVEVDFLEFLWEQQNGKCALTGVEMTYKFGSLFAASPDRIDSSVGYVIGNIQLVCKAVNIAKGSASDADLKEWIEAVRNSG